MQLKQHLLHFMEVFDSYLCRSFTFVAKLDGMEIVCYLDLVKVRYRVVRAQFAFHDHRFACSCDEGNHCCHDSKNCEKYLLGNLIGFVHTFQPYFSNDVQFNIVSLRKS